jgi:hypothetical protein
MPRGIMINWKMIVTNRGDLMPGEHPGVLMAANSPPVRRVL